MLANQFGHFKHANLFLSTKDRFKSVISVDVASVLFVLKIVLLDVRPHFFFATSVRGRALLPVTTASDALGVSGAMKAAFGFLFVAIVFCFCF